MSEYTVSAYFLEKKTIEQSFGSKDASLKEAVLTDEAGIIADTEGRFSGLTIVEAINGLIDGVVKEGFPFQYSYATWAIVEAITDKQPMEPLIGYPFMDLEEMIVLLKEKEYGALQVVFEALNGQKNTYRLPIDGMEWAELPCMIYLDTNQLKSLVEEVKTVINAIQDDEEWTLDIEEPDDIEQLLNWLLEASEDNQSICVVMDGDL